MKIMHRKFHLSSYVFIVLVMFMAGGVGLLPLSERINNLFYDAALSAFSVSVPDDVVIVSIDQASLDELGGWPWPRSTHAELINSLSMAEVQVVIFDVLFTEADRYDKKNDQELELALVNNGRIILPVAVEAMQLGGQFIEKLPLPEFTQGAVALGHVNVDLDNDGILRRVNLNMGLGDAFWPHISFVAASLVRPEVTQIYDMAKLEKSVLINSGQIKKNDNYLIPYYGPPGSFTHISYTDILSGRVSPQLLHGKIVFIGATATGLGDYLPTPMTQGYAGMSGVEINANIFSAIRQERLIQSAGDTIQHSTLLIVALVFSVVLVVSSQNVAIVFSFVLILLAITTSSLLLRYFQCWYAPANIIIVITISYAFWSWIRLRRFASAISVQLNQITENDLERHYLNNSNKKSVGFDFIADVFALDSLKVTLANGTALMRYGVVSTSPLAMIDNNKWYLSSGYGCITVDNKQSRFVIEATWSECEDMPPSGLGFIVDAASELIASQRIESPNIESMEENVRQLEVLSKDRDAYRALLSESMEIMRGGILIIDMLGKILYSNSMSRDLLAVAEPVSTRGTAFFWTALESVKFKKHLNWKGVIKELLTEEKNIEVEAIGSNGKSLLINLALVRHHVRTALIVVNISDVSQLKKVEKERAETIQFMSHDLRSPMVSLLALVEVYKDKETITKRDREEIFTKTKFLSNKALSLIDQFIELEKLENMPEQEYCEVDIYEVLDNAVSELDLVAKRRSVLLTTNFNTEHTWVRGENELLTRVMVNLISNGIKYSSPGGNVSINVYQNGHSLVTEVSDKGCGIAPQDIDLIFDRFYRSNADSINSEQGVGLGLCFVKKAVESMGGEIVVDSELGKGSRFRIFLPQ